MARPWGDNFRKLTRSEEGHVFERIWRRKLYEKFKTWKTVTMRLGNGDLLTSRNLDQKAKGPVYSHRPGGKNQSRRPTNCK